MKKTLLILAGGMGSRYGGLKQIDGFGPHNESILEYSLYDAKRAGFTDAVIVLRRDFLEKFEDKFANTFQNTLPVTYVFQEFDVTRFGGNDGSHREKPWGTGHAILSAKEVISGPFAAINADDWYGPESFQTMANALEKVKPQDAIMIAYQLDNTLSKFGGVNRGACKVSQEDLLEEVVEHLGIARNEDGVLMGHLGIGLLDDTTVSMGFWGFGDEYMDIIEKEFGAFVQTFGEELKKEFFIPNVVDDAIKRGVSNCKVYLTIAKWMGVSHIDDKPEVQEALFKLHKDGVYPEQLWK